MGRAETSAAPAALSIRYQQAGQPPAAVEGEPLLTVGYGTAPPGGAEADVSMAFPVLGGRPLIEVWRTGGPVRRRSPDDAVVAWTPTLLAGAVALPGPADAPIEETFLRAYRRMFRILDDAGFPHLVRIWNALPDITGVDDGMERYKRFCIGRARAFAERAGPTPPPAASAVGTTSPGVVVLFVAARNPGRHIENPRQVSAYHYPPLYGPKSPLFSRATLARWPDRETLFIAGTASVVGHESRHRNAADRQLAETIRNLDALIDAADFTPEQMASLKVYLRDPCDLDPVQAGLRAAYGDIPTLFLHGELCRMELALEVEAVLERTP